MGFLDRLRGKSDKSTGVQAQAEAATTELSAWLAGVMQRLEPSRIQFQPGETLGQVFARIFDEEEHAVRLAGGDPMVQQLKLESIQRLRQQFPADSAAQEPLGQAGGPAMGEAGRPAEATYEMVLGGPEDLKDIPMASLLQLISGWETVVTMVAMKNRLPDSLREEYKGAVLALSGEGKPELVVVFRAAKEMIELYREKLREAGLDQS